MCSKTDSTHLWNSLSVFKLSPGSVPFFVLPERLEPLSLEWLHPLCRGDTLRVRHRVLCDMGKSLLDYIAEWKHMEET